MAARASDARRLREYKVACYPITESLRIGLITRHEAFLQMRAAYVAIYGAQPTTATTITTKEKP